MQQGTLHCSSFFRCSNLCGCKGTAFLRIMQEFWSKKNAAGGARSIHIPLNNKRTFLHIMK